jgi:lipopolysaccharide export system protein LptA
MIELEAVKHSGLARFAAAIALASLLAGINPGTAAAQTAGAETGAAAPTASGPAAPQAAPPAAQAAPAATAPAGGQGPTGAFAGLSKNSDQPIDIESDVLLVHDAQKTATFKGNVKAVQGTTTIRSRELEVHYVGGGSDSLTAPPGAKDGAGKAGAVAAAQDKAADAVAGAAPAGDKVASADAQQPAATAAAPANATAKDNNGVALGDNGTKINKIYATGDVIITSDQDQTTTSDWALYDVPGQTVTVGGNVVLTQGKNVLKGDRLVIDLPTGESRFENTGNAATGGKRIQALFMPKQEAASGKAVTGDGQSGNEKSDDAKSGNDKPAADKAAADDTSVKNAPVKGAPAKAAPAQDNASPWQLVPGNAQ